MEPGSGWVVSSTLAAGIMSSVLGKGTRVAEHMVLATEWGSRVGFTGWGTYPSLFRCESGLHSYGVFLHQSKPWICRTGRREKPLMSSIATELCSLGIGSQSVPISLLVFLALMGLGYPKGAGLGPRKRCSLMEILHNIHLPEPQ